MFELSEKSNDKARLIGGLKYQVTLMRENVELLTKLYPELDHDLELADMAKLTQTLIDEVLDDV